VIWGLGLLHLSTQFREYTALFAALATRDRILNTAMHGDVVLFLVLRKLLPVHVSQQALLRGLLEPKIDKKEVVF